MNSMVDHPSHYAASHPGLECIDLAERCGFNLGNTVKYLWRYKDKDDPRTDLLKAAWYLRRATGRGDRMPADGESHRMLRQLAADASNPVERDLWLALDGNRLDDALNLIPGLRP